MDKGTGGKVIQRMNRIRMSLPQRTAGSGGWKEVDNCEPRERVVGREYVANVLE